MSNDDIDGSPGSTQNAVNRLKKLQEATTDAFGTLVTKGTQNALDLPAFYNFSEERCRFIESDQDW